MEAAKLSAKGFTCILQEINLRHAWCIKEFEQNIVVSIGTQFPVKTFC